MSRSQVINKATFKLSSRTQQSYIKHHFKIEYACVAQLVVQRIRNAQVAGSSPVTSSKVSCFRETFFAHS